MPFVVIFCAHITTVSVLPITTVNDYSHDLNSATGYSSVTKIDKATSQNYNETIEVPVTDKSKLVEA